MPGKSATDARGHHPLLGFAVLLGAMVAILVLATWGRLSHVDGDYVPRILHFIGTHAVAAMRGELLIHPDGFTLSAAALLLGVAVALRSAQ